MIYHIMIVKLIFALRELRDTILAVFLVQNVKTVLGQYVNIFMVNNKSPSF